MIALRFHREVYAGPCLDEAVALFAAHARFDRREESEHWVVELSVGGERDESGDVGERERERVIAGELGNYALGLTVKQRGHR